MLKNKPRLESVDSFRGFAIMSMILVNFLAFYNATPSYLKHATGIGITFADIVAPMFLFVLGMMYRKSIRRRFASEGRWNTYVQFGKRYILILFIGLAGGCVSKMSITFDWGILQAIGLAGLVALPFMELKSSSRIAAALLLIIIHQLAIIPVAQDIIIVSEHGGPIATLGWTSIILISSISGDLLITDNITKSIKDIAILGSSCTIIGLATLLLFSISKPLISSSYIFITTGASALTFILFAYVTDKAHLRIPTLAVLGKNALVIFLFHYIIIKVLHRVTDKGMELHVLLLLTGVVYGVCFLLAWILERKQIYVKV